MKHRDNPWRALKLIPTDDRLTQAAGLGTMVEVFEQSNLYRGFVECLPRRVSNRSFGAQRLALMQIASFLYGHECLQDIEEFRDDPLFEEALKGEVAAPRTLSDFLYDFEAEHIEKLTVYLSKMAHAIRRQLTSVQTDEHKPGVLHVSIDSTPHVQEGQKMEGLAWNYDGLWCLDSQMVFDELGFNHGLQLRPGNTKSGVDAEKLMVNALGRMKHGEEKWFSGDAAYCNQSVMKTALGLGAEFTLTANDATTGWKSGIESITNWEKWAYTADEVKRAGKKGKELPVIEVGSFLWEPSWSESLRFPIVVKRTWLTNDTSTKTQGSLFEPMEDVSSGQWEYYGVVTNMSLYAHKRQAVIERHNRRGNAENFIREEKYGYDLKHFPCQKLMANHAFGLLAMVAQNILRWIALIQRPDKPHFSKKLRRRFIFIPGKIIKHARQIVMKIPRKFYEEVMRLKEAWQSKPTPALDTC